MIPLNECEDGRLYRVQGRNFYFAVFNAKRQVFLGIREKFDQLFIDSENHWDAPAFATCKPLEALPEIVPDGMILPIDRNEYCQNCLAICAYVRWPDGGERQITISNGEKIMVHGQWLHLEATDCQTVIPGSIYPYPGLQEWLDQVSQKYVKVK